VAADVAEETYMQPGKNRLQLHATRNKNETPERLIVRASF